MDEEIICNRLGEIIERLTRIEEARPLPVDHPRFITIAAAAARAGLSEPGIRSLIARGIVTARRPLRGRILIDVHELDSAILGATARVIGGRGRPRRTTPPIVYWNADGQAKDSPGCGSYFTDN